MSYDLRMRHDEYLARYRNQFDASKYMTSYTSNATSINNTTQNGTYANGVSDAGLFANKCTDGKDDGKIGFASAVGNLAEGIIKGAWNGLTGMLGFGKNANGKTTWNPLKALGTIAIGAACIAFPVFGAIACTIGAVSGGVQLYNGIKGVVEAKKMGSDAAAKAAWENIGEGGATFVGCTLGAIASVGAMKSSASLSAIDDVAKAAGKSVDDILGSADDLAKAIDGADDSAKAASRYLKSKGITNADDIIKSVNDAADTTKIMDAAKTQGKSSSLDALKAKDLKGAEKLTETAKAFGKDAVSSTINNGKKVGQLAKSSYEAVDEFAKASKTKRKAGKELAAADDALKNGVNLPEDELEALKVTRDMAKVDADTASDALKGTKIGGKIEQGKTKFGELTTKVRGTNIEDTMTSLKSKKISFKDITSKMNKQSVSAVKNRLSETGNKVWNFLTTGEGTYAQAVQQYGYSNVLEVVKVLFAYGQVEQTV